jgi:hypothetical protein
MTNNTNFISFLLSFALHYVFILMLFVTFPKNVTNMFLFFALSLEAEKEGGSFIGAANPNLPDVSHISDPDECQGINTIRVNKTKCVCVDTFTFGDPYKEGCYKCIDQCNKSAKCSFPGRCVCNKGLYGDGVTKCEVPIAIIAEGAESKEYSSSGGEILIIMLKPYTRFTPLDGYCKFDESTVVKANVTDASYIGCVTPKLEPGVYKVFASFDNVTWSKKSIIAEFKESEQNIISVNPVAWVIVIAGFISFFVAYKYISKKLGNRSRFKRSLALTTSAEELANVPLAYHKKQ